MQAFRSSGTALIRGSRTKLTAQTGIAEAFRKHKGVLNWLPRVNIVDREAATDAITPPDSANASFDLLAIPVLLITRFGEESGLGLPQDFPDCDTRLGRQVFKASFGGFS